MPIGEAIFILHESGTKSQDIPPISDHSLERISFQKKYNIRTILPIVASRRNALLEEKPQFLTIFALVKYRKYRVDQKKIAQGCLQQLMWYG